MHGMNNAVYMEWCVWQAAVVWANKLEVFTYSGILLSNKNDETTHAGNIMAECQRHYAKWKKLDSKAAHCHRKKQSSNTCYNLDELWKHYSWWKKPDTKTTYCLIPFIWNIQSRHIHRDKKHVEQFGSCQGLEKREIRSDCLMGVGFPFGVIKMFFWN